MNFTAETRMAELPSNTTTDISALMSSQSVIASSTQLPFSIPTSESQAIVSTTQARMDSVPTSTKTTAEIPAQTTAQAPLQTSALAKKTPLSQQTSVSQPVAPPVQSSPPSQPSQSHATQAPTRRAAPVQQAAPVAGTPAQNQPGQQDSQLAPSESQTSQPSSKDAQGAIQNNLVIAPTSSDSGMPIPIIAGVLVAVVLLSGILLFFFKRRQRRNSAIKRNMTGLTSYSRNEGMLPQYAASVYSVGDSPIGGQSRDEGDSGRNENQSAYSGRASVYLQTQGYGGYRQGSLASSEATRDFTVMNLSPEDINNRDTLADPRLGSVVKATLNGETRESMPLRIDIDDESVPFHQKRQTRQSTMTNFTANCSEFDE